MLTVDVVDGRRDDVVVDGLHPFLIEGAGVLDHLLTDRPEFGIIGSGRLLADGPALEHPARQRQRMQQWELIGVWVVELLGLLLGVEVIQVAEEFVEPMNGGQVLVEVAEVVLAELRGRIPERLQQFGDSGILSGPTDIEARRTDLAHTGAVHALPADERRPSCGAALLAVGVGEPHPLVGDSVDVWRAIAHQAVAVATEIGDPDVVTPNHQNVGLPVRHGLSLVLC
jgi:hypothetical protein